MSGISHPFSVIARPAPYAGRSNLFPLISLIAAFLLLFPTTVFSAKPNLVKARAANGEMMDALPGQVIVKYKRGRESAGRSRIMKSFASKSIRKNEILKAEILSVPPGETIDSFIRMLQADPDVEYAEPNGLVRAFYEPSDPGYEASQNNYPLGPDYLNMPQAWDIVRGSSSIIIAVLDSGALLNHPDLFNRFAPGIGMTIGIDYDGDGLYDKDWNCLGNAGKEQPPMLPPMDDYYEHCLGAQEQYHGTKVAGVIGAEHNIVDLAGVIENSQLLIVKVLDNRGSGTWFSLAEGIVYASTNGARIVNMSLGGDAPTPPRSVLDAVDFALQSGVVLIAAAGNDAPCSVTFPASISGVIAVGATMNNNNHGIAPFSCTGTNLDVVAPGVNIPTLTSTSTIFSISSGTSFSAPLVSGLAGLMLSLQPNLTVSQLRQYLRAFAVDLGSPGFDTTFGYGRVDAYRTLFALNSTTTTLPTDFASPGKTYTAPNPYNPSFGPPVEFYWPSHFGTQQEELDITIMNLAGETIKKLNGTRYWDGKNESGNTVASGLYFYYLKTSRGNIVGKLTVVK